jgi:hypothetical protein
MRYLGYVVVSARRFVSFLRRSLAEPVTYLILAAIGAGAAVAAAPVLLEIQRETNLWRRLSGSEDLPERLDWEIARSVDVTLLVNPWYVGLVSLSAGCFAASLGRRHAALLAVPAGVLFCFTVLLQLEIQDAWSRRDWAAVAPKNSAALEAFRIDWHRAAKVAVLSLSGSIAGGVAFVLLSRLALWRRQRISVRLPLPEEGELQLYFPSRHLALLVAGWASLGAVLMTLVCWSFLFDRSYLSEYVRSAMAGQRSDPSSVFGVTAPLVVMLLLVGVIAYGRFTPKSAREVLQRHGRAPILYLRSFAADGKRLTSDGRIARLLSLDTLGYSGDTIERRLQRVLTGLGPFIAIGRPNERFAEVGAARIYLDANEWQPLVRWLIGNAQLVIIVAGYSAGLSWEYEQVRRLASPARVLILVPIGPGWRGDRRELEYARHRPGLVRAFGEGIPTRLGESIFLRFDDAWHASTVGPVDGKSSASVGSSDLLSALLAAFAEQLPLSREALAQERGQRWRIVRIVFITLAVAVPLGIAVFWLVLLLSVRR